MPAMNMMPAETQAAYQFALELAKQLLTLSTGLLGISITFTKDLVKSVPREAGLLLGAAWICLFLSIYNGLRHIGGLTTGLTAAGKRAASSTGKMWAQAIADSVARGFNLDASTLMEAGIYINPDAAKYGSAQDLYFRLAILLLILYGFAVAVTRMRARSAPKTDANPD